MHKRKGVASGNGKTMTPHACPRANHSTPPLLPTLAATTKVQLHTRACGVASQDSTTKTDLPPLRALLRLAALCTCVLLLTACSAAGKPTRPKPMLHMTVSDMFPGNPQAQALAKAAEKGDIATMDKLVAAGANPNATGEYGVTVPAWVILHPNKEGFRRLLELGADPNKIWRREDPGFDKSLMHFVVRETPNIGIEYLTMAIETGNGDPNLRVGKYKSPPMEEALCPVCIPAFATLLKAGGDMYYIDWFGRTYAMSAATQNNFKLVLFLLENGVDYTQKDNRGYDIASSLQVKFKRFQAHKSPQERDYMWFWRCIDFLEKRGATFTIPPDAIRPAVLDTTPPDIFAGLRKAGADAD